LTLPRHVYAADTGKKQGPKPQRLLGLGKGSEGAYCHHWGFSDGAAEVSWCFVYRGQTCSSGTLAGRGNVWGISAQPCARKVESRSQMMLDAAEAIHHTWQAVGLPGNYCMPPDGVLWFCTCIASKAQQVRRVGKGLPPCQQYFCGWLPSETGGITTFPFS